MPSKAEVEAAFKVFDTDGDGAISVAELEAIKAQRSAEQVQEHSDGMGAVRAAMDAEFGAAAAPGEDVDEQEPTLA